MQATMISVKAKDIYFSPTVFTAHDALNALANLAVRRRDFPNAFCSVPAAIDATSRNRFARRAIVVPILCRHSGALAKQASPESIPPRSKVRNGFRVRCCRIAPE
jgi:hypothetical protein